MVRIRRGTVVGIVATVLPLALVVGLSPIPIMPAMLLLMTSRGRANGLAYLAAWTVALALVAAAAVWVGRLADPAPAEPARPPQPRLA